MDLRAQAVSMWLRRWWIVGGALLVGVLVLAVSSLLPREYAASTTVRVVQIGGGEAAPQSETVVYYAQTVAGLAVTVQTLEAVVARSGLPLTPDEVAAQTEVTESSIPGFLTITARGDSADEAARLADATTGALAAGVAQDNAVAIRNSTAPLREQIQQLGIQLEALPSSSAERGAAQQQYSSLVEAVTRLESGASPQLLVGAPATPPTQPESPTPRRNAALAFLVALVVLAEGVVVVRALRGRLDERAPAEDLTRATGLPSVELRSGETATAVLAPLLRDQLPQGGLVTLVQLGGPHDVDIARELQNSAAVVGPNAAGRYGKGLSRIQSIRGRRIDLPVLEAVRREAGPVVLAVDTARGERRAVEEGIAALTAVGARVVGLVVWRGRFPRERRGASAAGPTASGPGAVTTPGDGDTAGEQDGATRDATTTSTGGSPNGHPRS